MKMARAERIHWARVRCGTGMARRGGGGGSGGGGDGGGDGGGVHCASRGRRWRGKSGRAGWEGWGSEKERKLKESWRGKREITDDAGRACDIMAGRLPNWGAGGGRETQLGNQNSARHRYKTGQRRWSARAIRSRA